MPSSSQGNFLNVASKTSTVPTTFLNSLTNNSKIPSSFTSTPTTNISTKRTYTSSTSKIISNSEITIRPIDENVLRSIENSPVKKKALKRILTIDDFENNHV